MRIVTIGTAALLAWGLAGCDDGPRTGAPLADGARAVATLRTPDGADVGRATATEVAGGLRFTIDVKGLPNGTHGAHVHMTGACAPPDFASAGGHWNPTGMKHGSMNPQGPHEGDLPNLIVGTDGRGTVGITIPGATMVGLLDADGSALVVHANADDLMTDPSGNSGSRIACGVFAAG
ncbi:MAG: superoxide dismutase [Sphingomonas bacterium]|jgi:Cu-Zn family superoxide dismutase|uniref:superoxide dismutase family protein n=1 Tax=Sphingomonas bacterium TaxID=1895847 RepID=UPI002608D744|nr:superoxide dismutase family protein [Sphingomonas bacterium]MDB5703669.1 superoxide dismutase [Sphingomonas bacterium]